MLRWKFWQKEPLPEAPEPEEIFDPDFMFGHYGVSTDEAAILEASKEIRSERLQRIHPDWMGNHDLPGLPPREYKFDEPEGHRPLAPRSATYRPPSLTLEEKRAVEIKQAISKFLDGPKYELKPALKKKHQESAKGPRRVYFDAKGKMKEVKEGA